MKIKYFIAIILIFVLFIVFNYPTITGYMTYGSDVISKDAWLNIVKIYKKNQKRIY